MGTVVVTRPPRRAAPPLPTGEVAIEPPPVIPQPTGARWQQWLSVLPMLAGTVATAMMFGGRDGASAYTYVVGGIFGLSTLGMLITNWGGSSSPRKAELLQARRDYLRYLSGIRRHVRTAIEEQRTALFYRHPEPDALWAEAVGPRVWERRAADGDFGVARVGLGQQSLGTALLAPTFDPTADLEPVTTGALRRFLDAYAVVPDLPIAVSVRAFSRIVLREERPESARSLARAMIAQLATFHAPDDLVIAACVGSSQRQAWEWLKWLPHALHPTEADALGPRRLIDPTLVGLEGLLADHIAKRPRFTPDHASTASPHVIVVVDGGDPAGAAHLGLDPGLDGVTVIEVAGAMPRTLDRATIVLSVGPDGELHSATLDDRAQVGTADRLGPATAESLARRLAPLRLAGAAKEAAPLAVDHDLTALLGIADAETAEPMWAPRVPRDVLRVPIGSGPDGDRVELDLKESAQDGMGPHGLLIGATGSGKSELLRTLVLGLAATHPSDVLNFVLIDFKGGATFATLDRLPHTSAVITNLAEELPLVDRMTDALNGELVRRQELLRRAGNFASVREYERARHNGEASTPALPTLLVVCDEFSELLTAKPEFIELFVQIGRVGRSLAVHLLLASQRLEEGRLRGLETHLSYRIGLRTFSAMESRAVLGVPDAYELPRTPGHGYLKFGTEPLRRFKAAYVSGPYRRAIGPRPTADQRRILDYVTDLVPATQAPDSWTPEPATTGTSLMDLLVGRLAGRGVPAHRVWLPPLGAAPGLDDLLGPLTTEPGRGVTVADATLRGALRVPIALVDKPFEQRRDVAWLDLAGAAGHVAIVGGPQSGKSTALRGLVTGLALTHTPGEVQVYCLDFGGGALGGLRELPHVGGVAGRLDTASVRRTVGEVSTLLADRERRFAARGVHDMATFRRLRRPADLESTLAVPEDGYGDVFLVVDGWSTLRTEYEDLEPVLADVATRGLSYGIHLVATASRWLDFRQNVKDLFGSKVELRLGDPGDSMVNRRVAVNVPERTPGRGLTADGAHLITALPQVASHEPAELVKAVAAAWEGATAPPVRMLPAVVPYSHILVGTEDGRRVPVGDGLVLPLGIAEADLRPVTVDFAGEPHLIAYGDSECGKSSLLRSLAETITQRFPPERARIVLVDYRRSLLGAITGDHLIGYGTTADDTGPLIASVADYMRARRPGPDVTPEQLRTRSWWEGPECFVLVDDYDLVATGMNNPLAPLVEHLAHARDVGLHLIVTRRAGGASSAMYDPVIKALRELGSPGLVMSGDRNEGALVGPARPAPLPPGRGWLVTRKEGVRLIQLARITA